MWPTSNLYRTLISKTLVFDVLSNYQQILRYKLLNIGKFLKPLKIQLSVDFGCFHLNFSPNYSIVLENIPKEKFCEIL